MADPSTSYEYRMRIVVANLADYVEERKLACHERLRPDNASSLADSITSTSTQAISAAFSNDGPPTLASLMALPPVPPREKGKILWATYLGIMTPDEAALDPTAFLYVGSSYDEEGVQKRIWYHGVHRERQDQTSLHYLLQQDPDNPRTEEFKLLWSTELTKGQTLSEETVDALRLQVRVTESAFHLLLQTISEHPWATNASAIAYNSLGIWNRATDQFEYSGANMIQPSINRRDNLSRRLTSTPEELAAYNEKRLEKNRAYMNARYAFVKEHKPELYEKRMAYARGKSADRQNNQKIWQKRLDQKANDPVAYAAYNKAKSANNKKRRDKLKATLDPVSLEAWREKQRGYDRARKARKKAAAAEAAAAKEASITMTSVFDSFRSTASNKTTAVASSTEFVVHEDSDIELGGFEDLESDPESNSAHNNGEYGYRRTPLRTPVRTRRYEDEDKENKSKDLVSEIATPGEYNMDEDDNELPESSGVLASLRRG